MASDSAFVEYICAQMGGAGTIASRKMFGEYAIYCEGKVVALVCDNQLFVKPTTAGRAFVGQVVEAPPYPGAKAHFVVGEKLDDREWVSSLIGITGSELPEPKPKMPRQSGRSR
ncbi:MAG: TfoX/Sxy family protein [Chlorobiaceae bacterium]|nr:TfoX/Sxy family protein [Chlorobiaceae bacterium]